MRIRTFDIGHSRIKSAIFSNGQVTENHSAEISDYTEFINDIDISSDDGIAFCSTDSRVSEYLLDKLKSNKIFTMDYKSFPMANHYKTPKTLGPDRMALAYAAYCLFEDKKFDKIIIIDAGTAITCDVIDMNEKAYLGGMILLGKTKMKRCLFENAPNLKSELEKESIDFPAQNTKNCISLGIQLQTDFIIDTLINDYCRKNKGQNIKITATGGDLNALNKKYDSEKNLIHYGLAKAFLHKIMGEK
ncbi:MAG: type III pantothenate kinase [Candidatus Zixiibacteriota bacterium]